MGLQVVRPISLVDGILDITNGEESRVEFTGSLSNGLTYATLTYITDQDQNGTRDSFKVAIDTDDLDSSGNFIHIVDLAWNSSNDYVLARIETNLGSWSINSSETDTASFKIATQIDPSDSALAGFQLINNRQDRTHPIAAISAEGIEDGVLNIDSGEEQLRIRGFLAEYRDDGQAGSGDPDLYLRWKQNQGAHEVATSGATTQAQQFLNIHYPSLYSSPDWESTEWGGGANAFGHVDVDHKVDFRWAMPGQWIVSRAHLDDKANEHNNNNSLGSFWWLNDDSKNIYPSLSFSRYWDSTQQTYVTQTGSENYINQSEFKAIHGLDLSTLEFEVVNSTPDITPPKFNKFDVPNDIASDGELNIDDGDILEVSGDVTDYATTDTVSGFSHSWIYLRRSHEYDADGNRVEVVSPDWDSDYIRFYINSYDSSATGTGNTVDFNKVIGDSRYEYKNEGDYIFDSVWIHDEAGNYYYYRKSQSDYDSLDPLDPNYSEVEAEKVRQKDLDFLAVAGLDVNSQAFNFRLRNSNVDTVLPIVELEQAVQIKDGVLDIPAGESSDLELKGTVTDLNDSGNPGSGLSSLSLTFEDVATQKQKSFDLSSWELDESGNFEKSLDFSNEAPGSWRITYANLSDKAGNSLRYDIDWNEESQVWVIDEDDDDNKARFKELGLDLDQWEFTLKNDDYDNLPPQGTFTTPDQLSDGILDLDGGESSSVEFSGTLIDQGKSGVDYLSINLKNVDREDDNVYIYISDYKLDSDGLFNISKEFKWKSGTYRPSSASLVDNADNTANVSSVDLLSANQIIRFKQATGIDLSSNTFNFTVKNDNADYAVPQADFVVPDQLADGILDINLGEDSTLEFIGAVSDGAGSGMSYLSIRLEDTETDKLIDLYLYSNDLTNTGEFSIKKDLQWKEGTYRPVSASISDQAGNGEYIYRNWIDDSYQELTAEQIQTFLEKTGIDLASNAFNFTIENDNADHTPPQASFNVPDQLSDGILDINSGEESTLEFTGSVSDGTGSGLSYLSIELEHTETDESIDLYLYSDDLTNTGEFSIQEDFQWKDGAYRPVSASINDLLGNYEGISRTWSDGRYQELTVDQIQAFQEKTGIDLSSFTFNFTVENDNADKSPPQASFNIPDQLSDGVLDISSGEDSMLEFTGVATDGAGSGISFLSIRLENTETDDSLDLYLYSNELTNTGEFSLKEDFQWKEGSYRPVSASINDQAGNYEHISRTWSDGRYQELTADQIQNFKEKTGINLSSYTFNFTVENENADKSPPQASFNIPDQLSDGVLDISSGEESTLEFTGAVTDGAGSGMSYLSIDLENQETNDRIYIELDKSDLTNAGQFSLKEDLQWKEGSYRPVSASISDQAGNREYLHRTWTDSGVQELTAEQIQTFLEKTGIDLASNAFNFTIENDNADNTPPQASFNVPDQLSDGILDINSGEESTLEFTGSVSDGTGSGLSYLSIELEHTETDESIDLYLYSDDLTNTGEFSIKKDLQWKEGTYRPVSASIRDQAGNREYLYRTWTDSGEQELTADQIQAFQEKTGIDLSSNVFNFTIENDNPDNSLPQANFDVPIQLLDGKLDLNAGESSTVRFTGSVSDGTGSGLDSLTVRLRRRGDLEQDIDLYIDSDDLESNGIFEITEELKWDEGTYAPYSASVKDNAGNYKSVYADDDVELSSSQVEHFRDETGIDLSSLSFNFTIENDSADNSLPHASFDVPTQLLDGKLDLNAGESSTVRFIGSVSDGTGSGLDSLTVRLRRRGDLKQDIDLYIDSDDLESNGIFEITEELKWNAGTYAPYSASIEDNAGNYKSVYAHDDVELSASQIEKFRNETGIDLSSNTFNFTIENDNPDNSLPKASFDVPTQLLDGRLDLNAGESSKVRFTGSVSDGIGSGLNSLTVQLRKQGDVEQDIYLYIESDDLESTGTFAITEDLKWDEGTYAPYSASIEDKAGNSRSVYAEDDYELSASQIERFRDETGIDLSSLAFNFSIENDNADSTVPQGRFDVPDQLLDGVLDIVNGESAQIQFSGQFEQDLTGSPLDYFYVELYNAKSEKIIHLSVDNYELDENMAFSFYYDASWDSGKYIPRYASLSDEAGNYVSAHSEDDKLTDKAIADFKKSTGIDLSSNTFNFSVNNSKADTSPPVISDLSITGENLSLLNGIKTLSVVPGQDSSVKVQGTISDEPAGFDSLWIELLEKNSGSRVSGSIDSYEVDSSGNFEVVFDFEYLTGGDWILGGFNINDRANNEAYYWTDGQNPGNSSWEKEQIEILNAIGVDINSFEINVGNENTDSTAPVISNVVLNYDQDTSRVVFNGDIKDDLSGFDYLWLRLENQEVSEHFWLDVADWSIDWDENEEFTQRAGSFSLAERRSDLPSGTYVITDAQLSDRAGNSIDLWRWDGESDKNNAISQLKNSGLDIENLSLEIVNPDADSLLPVFTDFSISRTGSIDVESDSIVKISGNVSDADGSGFSSLHIILVDGNGTEKSISLNKDSEELTEAGDFTLDIDFKYSAAGTWRLKEAFLMDEAGNQASFYDGDWDSNDEAAKFLASGIDLEQFIFDISNNNQQDISLPQITELLLQRNGSQVELSGIIDDGLLGSGLDEFRISLYNFTIKEWIQLEVAPADLSLETGAFSVTAPYEYLTNAEWRIENIYLSDIAGNNVNYWRSGWDANLQSKRLLGTLLNPEGTQFILDPLIDLTNGETSAGLVGGGNALIELDYNPVFLEEDTNDSALDDVEVVNDLADGLEDVLGEEESITSELVSFNADVRGDSGSAVDQIYRFELNLPGDVNKISIKKQFADKSQGFADFKNVFTDSNVGASSSDGQRAEGLTVEDGKLILYIKDQGIFDHNPLEGFITDPFVVTNQAKELQSIVKPKPLARPEGVADEQQKNDLETLVEDSVNEEEAADDDTSGGTDDDTSSGTGGDVNDVTPPTIESAVIDGDVLTITLDEDINPTVPKVNNFKVKIGRKKNKVESVTVDQAADTVVLDLKNAALVTDEEITLDYKTKKKDQETGVIEDLAGNDLQSIKNVEVKNNTFVDPNVDNRFPEIADAEINGDVLIITLDEDINPTVPKANNFKVKIGRKKSKVESVTVDQATNTVVLALKNAALPTDEEITLDYKTKKKDQESGVIEDLAGNDLQSIKNVDVDNNTFVDPNLDLMAPTIVNAEINGDVLTITLDEAIDSTVPKVNNFKVKIGRKKSKVESVDVFDTTKLIAADLIDSEGAATSAPSHNSIIKEAEFRALIGVFAASNGQSAIFTTVAPHDPSFANGVQATVGAETFEWNVAGHGANPDAGTGPHATRDGDNLSFTDDELAAMRSTTGTVSLKLKNAALPTDTEITLDYKTKKKDQVTGVIEDLAGNDLQSLKDFEVSNVTTPNTISGLSAEVAVPWVRLPSIGGVGIDPEVLLDANPDPGLAGNPDVGSTFFSKTFGVDGMGLVPIATEIVDSFSAL